MPRTVQISRMSVVASDPPRPRVYRSVTGDAAGIAPAVLESDTSDARLTSLFEAYHVRLYRLARRMTSGPDDAKDLVQETFLRAARAPRRIPVGRADEEAWLVRVLVNVSRDLWRRQAVRTRAGERGDIVAGTPPDPEAALVARTTVWRALRALAPRRRVVVILHEIEGLDTAEVARALGVSRVTVRWHLARARRELARIVGPMEDAHE